MHLPRCSRLTTMSSAAADDKQNVANAVDDVPNTYGFANIPVEIVRKIFEVSVFPSSTVDDDHQRQQTAYACCLVSKDVKDWVEPLLYEKVVLESTSQVVSFLQALKIKAVDFIARTVKKIWILDENLADDAVQQLHRLFSKCISLKSFACIGNDPCSQALRLLRIHFSHSDPLQELAIILPDRSTSDFLRLRGVSTQVFQIIDAKLGLFRTPYGRIRQEDNYAKALRATPRIFFDLTTVPSKRDSLWFKSEFLPLLRLESPESNNILYLRSAPAMARDLDPEERFDDVDSWVRSFDDEVQQCEGRLVVCPKLITAVHAYPGAPHFERCKPWIGLYE